MVSITVGISVYQKRNCAHAVDPKGVAIPSVARIVGPRKAATGKYIAMQMSTIRLPPVRWNQRSSVWWKALMMIWSAITDVGSSPLCTMASRHAGLVPRRSVDYYVSPEWAVLS